MKSFNLSERLIDPHSPDRRPRRAAYALPTLFTAGNVFLGFLAIMKAFQGALLALRELGPQSALRSRGHRSAWRCCWTAWTAGSPA